MGFLDKLHQGKWTEMYRQYTYLSTYGHVEPKLDAKDPLSSRKSKKMPVLCGVSLAL